MKFDINKYEALRPDLQTGDEVICGGKGFFSRIIQLATWSWASHVGKIYKDAFGCIWIWHSTLLSKGKSGPQREQFRTFLKRYNGRVEVRQLKFICQDLCWRPYSFQHIYINTIIEFKDKEYEDNKLELAGSAMPWNNKPNLASIFCSEMTAEIDMRTGVLATISTMPANEYTPADSLENRKKDWNLKNWNLKDNWRYLKAVRLK